MTRTIAALFTLLLGLGCAGVGIYQDPGCTETTAIPVCAPAPHLAVHYTGGEEPKLEIRLLFLPDFSSRIYIRPERGWGSSKAQIELENGILKSFQCEGDAKAEETVEAVGGAVGDIASAFTGVLGALKETSEEQALDVGRLEALRAELEPIVKDLKAMASKADLGAPETEKKKLMDTASVLEGLIRDIDDPEASAGLEIRDLARAVAQAFGPVKAVDVARYKDDPVSAKGVAVVRNVLGRILEGLTPPSGGTAFFKLYRIHTDRPGETRLELVHAELP